MRPKVKSNWFETSNRFEKSFRLHGNFKPLSEIVTFTMIAFN